MLRSREPGYLSAKFPRIFMIPQTLRHYQEECIKASIGSFDSGLRRIAVNLPVGSGKTVIFANLIPRIQQPIPSATKTLILAHRKELLTQAYNVLQKHAPNLKLGLEVGSKKPPVDADVVIASVNMLGRKESKRLQNYKPEQFKTIIIDEAHHAAASSYQSILNHFRVFDPESHIKLWGCSATLRRHDGLALGDTFEDVVYTRKVAEMIDEKWLCSVKVTRITTGVDISKLSTVADDFNLKQLAEQINIEERNQLIVQTFLEQSGN